MCKELTIGEVTALLNMGKRKLKDVYEGGDPLHKHVYRFGPVSKAKFHWSCKCGREGR